ncbi:hypothetical protein [Anabaena catenula]|nr:hypothetical protein [Anabaena catenula]
MRVPRPSRQQQALQLVEQGHINRLTMLKRQMYGRAKIDLL